MYFVVQTSEGEVLVESSNEQQAVLDTPNASSARIAQYRDIERLQAKEANTVIINANPGR